MARLLSAMSGGVDSSVATALAIREGHEVVGATLKQWEFPDEETLLTRGCCTLDAVEDARRVAGLLGIPHYVFDFRDVFAREVVGPFVEAYASGRTPNPCVRCNERVRFGELLAKALKLGFDGVITGHWARVQREEGSWRLYRSANAAKDQSYVLHALGQDALSRARFPLGGFASKDEVRAIARELGLPNHAREDSVDVCFVGDRSPGDVVAEQAPGRVRPGPVLDTAGREVGRHRGLAHYTVGQRRGLGNLRTLPGEKRYVTALDADRNAVVVADRDALEAHGLDATDPSWVTDPPTGEVEAVVRYQARPVAAAIEHTPDGFTLRFREPVTALAPGQAVVCYRGDEVLGGGTILRAS